MQKISFSLLIFSLLLSCENSNGNELSPVKLETHTQEGEVENPKKEAKANDSIAKEVVRINKTTKIKSVLTLVNGEKNGLCKQYYPSGELWKESMYTDNSLDGISKIYYKSGKLKREVNFSYRQKDGKFLEYFKSGNIKTEITYDKDLPLPGFKEINYRKQKVKQANIKVRHEDRLFASTYNLYFLLDGDFKNAKIYAFENKSDWNSATQISVYELDKQSNNEFKLEVNIPKGFYYVDDIHVFAAYETKGHNDVVVYKKVNLAVSND